MLDYCIYNILDDILPVTDKPKHETLSLKYLSACEIMKTENDILKICCYLPAVLFEPLFQSVIYDCYFKFTASLDISTLDPDDFSKIDIPFPKTLGILILNWPYEDFILRDQIPSLSPPVDIFPSSAFPVVSKKQAIGQVDDMHLVFKTFCNRLIEYITQAVFEYPPTNPQGFVCNIRRMDVTGLEQIYSFDNLDYILKGIRNSTIVTFGHKIEIYSHYVSPISQGFDIIRNIIEESLKPDVGISVFFKTFYADCYNHNILSNDFYNVLSLGGCKYIQLLAYGPIVDQSYAENLSVYLPGLVGIDLTDPRRIESLDFLSSFENLEQLTICGYKHKGLTNSICNFSKGLKYLNLSCCFLKSEDLECLSKSVHSDSLLQLDISENEFENESEVLGIVPLCRKLKNIKVFILDSCSLHKLSSNMVSKLINAFKDCDKLEFLSMKGCYPFSLEKTTIIIDGLAQNKSLRYLSLNLPGVTRGDIVRLFHENDDDNDDDLHHHYYDDLHHDDEGIVESNNVDMEYLQNLFQTFNEKINKFRQSPIFISWVIDEA